MQIRPEQEHAMAGVRAVHEAAFETGADAGLVEALRQLDPGCLKAASTTIRFDSTFADL